MKNLKALIPIVLSVLLMSSCEKDEINSIENANPELKQTSKASTNNVKSLNQNFTIANDASETEIEDAIEPYMINLEAGIIILKGEDVPNSNLVNFQALLSGDEPTPNPERVLCKGAMGWGLVVCIGEALLVPEPCGRPVIIAADPHGVGVKVYNSCETHDGNF